MNNETIFNAISKLDEELIDGSFPDAQPVRKKPPIALKLILAAAALLAAAGIGAGVSACTADVREYNAALEFFSSNSLSTEGLSRSEIKEVYRDITTNSFSNSATVNTMNNSIPGLNLEPGEITPADINSAWFSNFVIPKANNYIKRMSSVDEYLELDATNGLDVIAWQVASGSYSFGLLEHSDTPRYRLSAELLGLIGVNAEKMRGILSSYDVSEDKVYVIPWQNPLSSYLPEYLILTGEDDNPAAKEEAFIAEVREILFG